MQKNWVDGFNHIIFTYISISSKRQTANMLLLQLLGIQIYDLIYVQFYLQEHLINLRHRWMINVRQNEKDQSAHMFSVFVHFPLSFVSVILNQIKTY